MLVESDKTYRAKVAGKGWLKGKGFTDKKANADEFESKTEPTQRINQMKKDGDLNKNLKITIFENILNEDYESLDEAIEDFPASARQMYRYARKRHNDTGAIRKVSKQPYWVHPDGVAKIVLDHGGNDLEVKAALAHDVLEDTLAPKYDIEDKFGKEVADIVSEVTSDKNEIAKIGKERYISEELVRLSPEALTVKLADMLYNITDSPTPANYDRMKKNVAYLLQHKELSGKHLELANEILAA